jgi:hypothetical protein
LFREVVQLVFTYCDERENHYDDGSSEWVWEFAMGPTEVANLLGRVTESANGHRNGIRRDVRKVIEALCEIGLMKLEFRQRGTLPSVYLVRPSVDVPWADAAEFLGLIKKAKRKRWDAQASHSAEVLGDAQAHQGDAQASLVESRDELRDAQASPDGTLRRPLRDAQASPPLPIRDREEEMAEVVEEPSPQDAREDPLPDVNAYASEIRAAMKARPLQQLQSARRQLGRIGQDAAP